MKKGKWITALVGAGLSLSGCVATAGQTPPSDAEALRAVLNDEYRAEATYEAVMARFGEVRPFVNIIRAEQRHSERVRAEMARLGLDVTSTNPFLGTITAPATLVDACAQGVTAERENIALYDEILPRLEDQQVRTVLTALQRASRDNHLPAFERCVARGGEPMGGPGGGRGNR